MVLAGPHGRRAVSLLVHRPATVDRAPVLLGLNFRGNHTTTFDEGVSITTGQLVEVRWQGSDEDAVVIGYDLDEGAFLLRSGPMERQVLPFLTFEATWARSERWAFVALPAGQLAATASEAQTTRALVAFEKAAPPASAPGASPTQSPRAASSPSSPAFPETGTGSSPTTMRPRSCSSRRT